MRKKSTSAAYLERHLQSAAAIDLDFVRKTPLYQPLGEVAYEEEGEIELFADDGDIAVRYAYSPADRSLSVDDRVLTKEQVRRLDMLTIANMTTGKSQDVMRHIPPEYTVLFAVEGAEYGKDAVDVAYQKTVKMVSGLASPASLLALSHEIGHAVDAESSPHLYRAELMEYADAKSYIFKLDETNKLASLLERERNAWAHAFRILRPVLSHDPEKIFSKRGLREDHSISRDVYGVALQSYSNTIHQERSQGSVARLLSLGRAATGIVLEEVALALLKAGRSKQSAERILAERLFDDIE